MEVHEHHHRTLIKSVTWFIVGFLVSFGVIYALTHDTVAAFEDAILIQAFKFVFFYIHERIWFKINLGRKIVKKVDSIF